MRQDYSAKDQIETMLSVALKAADEKKRTQAKKHDGSMPLLQMILINVIVSALTSIAIVSTYCAFVMPHIGHGG